MNAIKYSIKVKSAAEQVFYAKQRRNGLRCRVASLRVERRFWSLGGTQTMTGCLLFLSSPGSTELQSICTELQEVFECVVVLMFML